MSEAKKTKDHEVIKEWAEERGGRPAIVKGTEAKGDEGGVLRVKFDENEDNLETVEWDEFFETFDERDLSFLYQEEVKGGNQSRFFKFVNG